MHNLDGFSIRDLVECSARVRRLGQGAASMEEAAGRIVTYLYDDLADQRSGARACALVRFYKTHPYGLLDAGRRRFASAQLPGEVTPPTARCLTLLATTGDEPAWRSVAASRDHQAIPIENGASAARVPMVIRLVTQLGIKLEGALPAGAPGTVFHVPEAVGNPEVPSQETFVIRHGIRSILGIGGLLPSGELFAVVLFTKVPVGTEARDLFKPLALAVKVSVMAFASGPIFHC